MFGQKKQLKKGNRLPKRRKQPQASNRRGISSSVHPNDIMPLFKEVFLNFIDPNAQISAASTFLIKSISINDLYDPDPAILTTGYAGYEQLMGFYEFARADSVGIRWVVTNNETFPNLVGIVCSQIDLSSVLLTRQSAIDALENGVATRVRTIQGRNGGQSTATYSFQVSLKSLLANPTLYQGSPDYLSTSTSSPTDKLWANFIVVGPTTAVSLVNGVIGTIELRVRARLFGRKVLGDTPSPLKPITPQFSKVESHLDSLDQRVERLSQLVRVLATTDKT